MTTAPPPAAWTTTKERWVLAALAGGTVLVFARVLFAGFAGFDDLEYVVRNPNVNTGLSAANVAWAFTGHYVANWHPLTWLSLMLDVSLFGLRPEPMHAVNVILHAANVALVYLFLKHTFGRQAEAAWAAALFAVHPLHVESVAWITERKDVLSTLFGLLSLLAYVRWAREGKRRDYALALLALLAGLLSKAMLVTWPFVLLLLDAWPLERRRQWLEKVPFIALAAAVSAATLYVQSTTGAVADAAAPGAFGQQLANASWGYWWYLTKTALPIGLAAHHPFAFAPGGDPLSAAQVGGAAVLLALLTALALRGGSKMFRFGWLWYLGTLVPVIGLVRVGSASVAERYMYVPSIGLFAALVFLAADLARSRPAWRALMVDGAAVAVLGLAAQSWVQQGHWLTEEAVYRRALAVHPRSALMQFNLAGYLHGQQRLDEAAEHYRLAFAIDKTDATAQLSLGQVLLNLGREAEAEVELRAVVALQPGNVEARYRLAQALALQKKADEARVEFERVVAADSKHAGAEHSLAILALHRKDAAAAQAHAQKAVALGSRQQPNALATLADALRAAGQGDEADRTLDEAIALAEKQGQQQQAQSLRARRQAPPVVP